MKQIRVTDFTSTGVYPDFEKIEVIEIENKPFAQGGFGEVYKCCLVDGNVPKHQQVIKIFKDNLAGSEQHNNNTIRRLQRKLGDLNNKLLANEGKNILEKYPGFKAIPQFAFTGILQGEKVTGFSANNLVELGFTEFEEAITEGSSSFDEYCNIPVQKKALMAYHLVSIFKVLEDFGFIHADIKEKALFVHLQNHECVLIDFDSGVITETADDSPNTWGVRCDFVAPEIFDQLKAAMKEDKIMVDIFTDRWSVAIAIHYLLTSMHPLFYLPEMSRAYTSRYFAENKWPFADTDAFYFEKENLDIYNEYTSFINTVVPPAIVEKLSQTINYGYQNPAARTTYLDWKKAIESTFTLPVIVFFRPETDIILEGLSIKLLWETQDATSVTIDNGIGAVSDTGQVEVKPKHNTLYTLKAIGLYGEVEWHAEVKVSPMPTIESIKVPMPDLSIILDSNVPEVELPPVNYTTDLSGFKRLEMEYFSINYSSAYNNDNPLYIMGENFCTISKVFEMVKHKLNDSKTDI